MIERFQYIFNTCIGTQHDPEALMILVLSQLALFSCLYTRLFSKYDSYIKGPVRHSLNIYFLVMIVRVIACIIFIVAEDRLDKSDGDQDDTEDGKWDPRQAIQYLEMFIAGIL